MSRRILWLVIASLPGFLVAQTHIGVGGTVGLKGVGYSADLNHRFTEKRFSPFLGIIWTQQWNGISQFGSTDLDGKEQTKSLEFTYGWNLRAGRFGFGLGFPIGIRRFTTSSRLNELKLEFKRYSYRAGLAPYLTFTPKQNFMLFARLFSGFGDLERTDINLTLGMAYVLSEDHLPWESGKEHGRVSLGYQLVHHLDDQMWLHGPTIGYRVNSRPTLGKLQIEHGAFVSFWQGRKELTQHQTRSSQLINFGWQYAAHYQLGTKVRLGAGFQTGLSHISEKDTFENPEVTSESVQFDWNTLRFHHDIGGEVFYQLHHAVGLSYRVSRAVLPEGLITHSLQVHWRPDIH